MLDLSLSQKRRRRRRSLEVDGCPREPGPKLLFVPPHQTSANITNLRKFVKYRIWVRAYNSIGESPPSSSLEVTTQADSKLCLCTMLSTLTFVLYGVKQGHGRNLPKLEILTIILRNRAEYRLILSRRAVGRVG